MDMKYTDPCTYALMTDKKLMNIYSEEDTYQSIFSILLMSGEYREQDIDEQVMYIMDHPEYFPDYF